MPTKGVQSTSTQFEIIIGVQRNNQTRKYNSYYSKTISYI
jgi:hypothetical protein